MDQPAKTAYDTACVMEPARDVHSGGISMACKGQAIFMVYTDLIDLRYEQEFNAWYNTEHLPELLALPGFLDAARYVATRGGPRHLAVYEIESLDAMQTPEFKNRPRTPWGQRVSPSIIGKNLTR